jgi:hypothetical protein
MVRNDAVNRWDYLGLEDLTAPQIADQLGIPPEHMPLVNNRGCSGLTCSQIDDPNNPQPTGLSERRPGIDCYVSLDQAKKMERVTAGKTATQRFKRRASLIGTLILRGQQGGIEILLRWVEMGDPETLTIRCSQQVPPIGMEQEEAWLATIPEPILGIIAIPSQIESPTHTQM